MENKKRLIDANALEALFDERNSDTFIQYHTRENKQYWWGMNAGVNWGINSIRNAPSVDAVEVVHGRWELTAHEEYSNYRWNVTAECSVCHHSKGEIYAGFFPGYPRELARGIVRDCAKSVKLDNYCPNCGAKMDGDGNDL